MIKFGGRTYGETGTFKKKIQYPFSNFSIRNAGSQSSNNTFMFTIILHKQILKK